MPFYLRVAGKHRSGDYVHVSLKAWKCECSDTLYWDAVRLASIVGVNTAGGTVFKTWWKRYRQKFFDFCAVLGYDASQCFLPSLRASKATHASIDENSRSVPVWTTQGVISTILFLSCESWLAKDKEQWSALLDGVLALRRVDVQEVVNTVCTRDPWEACSTWNVQRNKCKHVDPAGLSEMEVVLVVQTLVKGTGSCQLCVRALREYIDAVTRGVESDIESVSYTQDPLEADAPPQLSNKRIRRDEDYKVAVLTTAVQEGRARSSNAMARALKDEKARPDKWMVKYILEEQAAMWVAVKESSEFVLVFDGGRFGNPAEETLVSGISWQSDGVSRACFLPCQSDNTS
eukprot:1587432-Amphidinium_carterae.3